MIGMLIDVPSSISSNLSNYNSSFVRVVQRAVKESLILGLVTFSEDYFNSLPDIAYDLILEWTVKERGFIW